MNDIYRDFEYPGSELHSGQTRQKMGNIRISRTEPIVKACDIAYILFNKIDLQLQKEFLVDFGFQVAEETPDALYMRGTGALPYFYAAYKDAKRNGFVGAGYSVNLEEELQHVSEICAQPISAIDGPGGGQRVRLEDPDGFIVDLVWGRKLVNELPQRQVPAVNTPAEKARVNAGIRTKTAPSPVHRLGHYVMSVSNFEESMQWYMRHVGIIPTDVQCLEDGTPALAFNRLDKGVTPADHHTIVLVQNVAAKYMHSAYETLDIDSVGQGQQHLKIKGWQHFWGIGRHILGSQVFDYWLDPTGDELEHYADGDVFDADFETRYHPLDLGSLWAWGDDVPTAMRPHFSLKQMIAAVRAIRSGKIESKTLRMLKRAMERPARPWL
jgi:hypothetical protein